MQINRTGIILSPNKRRVVLRPFHPPGDERILRVVARVCTLSEEDVDHLLAHVFQEFHGRHHDPQRFFERRFETLRRYLLTDVPLSENRRLLLGAYFTQEYALESAALFNPSMVRHPDQTNLPTGTLRFAMSMRAVGEGHISSIVFRSGTITSDLKINVDEPSSFVTTPTLVLDSSYENDLFHRKLIELGLGTPFINNVLIGLPETFTFAQLDSRLRAALREHRAAREELSQMVEQVIMLAKSNYEVQHRSDQLMSERLVFPLSQRNVMASRMRVSFIFKTTMARGDTTRLTVPLMDVWCYHNYWKRQTSCVLRCTHSTGRQSPTRVWHCFRARSTVAMPCWGDRMESICFSCTRIDSTSGTPARCSSSQPILGSMFRWGTVGLRLNSMKDGSC